MTRFRNFTQAITPPLLFAVCLLCALGLAQLHYQTGRTHAVATQVDQQALQTILREVQQTRLTVQRSMTVIYRAQTLLAEARLRTEQINRLQKELDQFRADAIEDQAESQRQNERLRDVSARIAQERDAQQLETLRAEEDEIRLLIQEHSQDETFRQEREVQVNKNLQAEKVRLTELNRQIGALEREMAALVRQEKQQQ